MIFNGIKKKFVRWVAAKELADLNKKHDQALERAINATNQLNISKVSLMKRESHIKQLEIDIDELLSEISFLKLTNDLFDGTKQLSNIVVIKSPGRSGGVH